jgi:hypothetical protein
VGVLVDFFGGDFAGDDAAEEAVGIGHGEFARDLSEETIALRREDCQPSG